MNRQRAQSIIIQNNKVLFGVGLITEDYYGHFFIGGGVEDDESPEEAALRELREEANVDGQLLFKLEFDYFTGHHTYLVDIGEQVPSLGNDPEMEEVVKDFSKRALQGLELIDISEYERFTGIDIIYFKALVKECSRVGYEPRWLAAMKDCIVRNSKLSL